MLLIICWISIVSEYFNFINDFCNIININSSSSIIGIIEGFFVKVY